LVGHGGDPFGPQHRREGAKHAGEPTGRHDGHALGDHLAPGDLGLGVLLAFDMASEASDALPALTWWLVLATPMLMVAAVAQVIGQEDFIPPVATGRARSRGERRWRRWAIAGWTVMTVATVLLMDQVSLVSLWDSFIGGSSPLAVAPPTWMVVVGAWAILHLLLVPRSWRRLRSRIAPRRNRADWTEDPTANEVTLPGKDHSAGPISHGGPPQVVGPDAVSEGTDSPRSHGKTAEDLHSTPARLTPLFRYERGQHVLTISPNGTLQQQNARKEIKTEVSLVNAISFSVDYEGEFTIVGREKVLAKETLIVVRDRSGRRSVIPLKWGMPRSVKEQLERTAASFSPTVAASLAATPPAQAEQRAGWRAKVATISAWTSGIGAAGAGFIFFIMEDSGVDSDQSDPLLWKAMLVCSGLAASAFLTLLDPPISRGRLGIGVAGVAGLVAIPLAWGFLTGS
jgi:hypothetical protein